MDLNEKKEKVVELLVDTLTIALLELQKELNSPNISHRQKGIAAKTLAQLVNKFNISTADTNTKLEISIVE